MKTGHSETLRIQSPSLGYQFYRLVCNLTANNRGVHAYFPLQVHGTYISMPVPNGWVKIPFLDMSTTRWFVNVFRGGVTKIDLQETMAFRTENSKSSLSAESPTVLSFRQLLLYGLFTPPHTHAHVSTNYVYLATYSPTVRSSINCRQCSQHNITDNSSDTITDFPSVPSRIKQKGDNNKNVAQQKEPNITRV